MQGKILLLIILILTFSSVYAADEQLRLPSGDLIAPKVKHVPSVVKQDTDKVTISAEVTDNVAVEKVILFYRNIGAADYSRVQMKREIGNDTYAVSIDNVLEPGVEYYIQATDPAGNTILHGHSFSPLKLMIGSKTPAENTAFSESKPALNTGLGKQPLYKNKWVWITAGVLVGGIAIASGGDKDDGGSEATVTISAPTP